MLKSLFISLQCLSCKKEFGTYTQSRCDRCGSVLSSSYAAPEKLVVGGLGIWKFRHLLPPIKESNIVSLGEGSTPCITTERIQRLVGVKNVILKLESTNPTGSFKDRAAALGVSIARELSKKGVFVASSGNAAAAVAAYSARAGLRCIALVRENASPRKLSQIEMFGPTILRVRDLFSTRKKLEKILYSIQEWFPDWFNHFLWAPINPLLVDAFKTISYEIFLTFKEVDCVFVPVAGGDLIFGLYKGFKDLLDGGFLERIPRLVAVQADGARPTILAIEGNLGLNEELARTRTVATALDVGFPSEHALIAVRESKGFGISVSDRETLYAKKMLSYKEGVFCETSSATVIAAIKKAREMGKVERESKVCAVITGSGLKDQPTGYRNVPLARSFQELRSLLASALQ